MKLTELNPPRKELFGAVLGRAHATDLSSKIGEKAPDTLLATLDFEGVIGVTPSYFKSFFAALDDGCLPYQGIFALVNVSEDPLLDLSHFLTARRRAMILVPAKGEKNMLVGEIDPVLRQVFSELEKVGPSTAVQLKEKFYTPQIPHTTINNRLAALFKMGLAIRKKEGRSLIYSTISHI